jgi:hypothetical protein
LEYGHVRRTPRYPLAVDIELYDPQSETQINAQTKMLSMFGCGVDSTRFFPQGTSVTIKLSYQGEEVRARGRIVYASPDLGMGLAFTGVERDQERILEWWITEHVSAPSKNKVFENH